MMAIECFRILLISLQFEEMKIAVSLELHLQR